MKWNCVSVITLNHKLTFEPYSFVITRFNLVHDIVTTAANIKRTVEIEKEKSNINVFQSQCNRQ